MKILDRYILKKFLFTFFAILLAVAIIIGLVDFTNKNEMFIRAQMSYLEIADYYSAFLPFLVNLLTPIIVFITVIFVTSQMAQRTEIVAILSSGVSYQRFIRPYIIGASVISIFSFILIGWVLASLNKKRISYEDKLGVSVFFVVPKYLHIRISPEEYLYIEKYHTMSHMGTNATIETIHGDILTEKLYSKYIRWDEEKEVWIFEDWVLRHIDGIKETITQDEILEKNLNLHPKDLAMNPRLYETLNLPELHRHIKDLKSKQSDSVRLFITEAGVRYMAPFSSIILTIMGVLVSSYRSRRGAGLQLTIGGVFAFIYIAMFLFSRSYAEAKGANIIFTLWTPNILFAAMSYIAYRLVPK